MSDTDIDALIAAARKEANTDEREGGFSHGLLRSLAAALAALKADAERYRWLRLHVKDRNVWQPVNAPELFDAAIDAALLATEKE